MATKAFKSSQKATKKQPGALKSGFQQPKVGKNAKSNQKWTKMTISGPKALCVIPGVTPGVISGLTPGPPRGHPRGHPRSYPRGHPGGHHRAENGQKRLNVRQLAKMAKNTLSGWGICPYMPIYIFISQPPPLCYLPTGADQGTPGGPGPKRANWFTKIRSGPPVRTPIRS